MGLLGVAVAYLGFVAWFVPTVRTWSDPVPTTEPSPFHYLSGKWRRHYLSLFERFSPVSVLHALMGLPHYLVMVPLTCIYWISAPILNGIDRIAMVVRRARIKCGNAGCYKQVDLPVHVCPKCDERHRELRPGRYGLFQRNCQCGSPLPSMLVCGRYTLKTLCPHCSQPLGWTFNRDLHIVLVAGPAAGKTSLLTGLFHALRQMQRDGMVRLQFSLPDHEKAFDTSLHAFQHGYVPDKTRATLPASFVIQLVNRRREIINVHVYDVAGEVYQDRESLQSHAYFSHADAVLFLVDPFSLHEVQQQVGERLDPYRDKVTACDEVPQHVYDRLLTVLRSFKETSSRLGSLPVAVTLTKCDAFALNLGVAAPKPTDESTTDSREVRQWLEERGEGNLVRSLEHDFSRVSFFACSALGHLPDDDSRASFEPVGVLAPLEWLLAQAGYPLRCEERKDDVGRSASTRASATPRAPRLVAGANSYAWVALAAALGCWMLPNLTCQAAGASIAILVSILAFMRSARVLGQGAWVAGLSLVIALVLTTTLSADEAYARYKEREVAATFATAMQKAQEEDFFTARTLLTGLVAEDPTNGSARVELARVESRLVRQLLEKGEAALVAGDYAKADQSFRTASRLRGGESAASGLARTRDARVALWRGRAREALAKGDLPAAELALEQALSFDADNATVHAELSVVLEQRVALTLASGEKQEGNGKFDEARKTYESAYVFIPDHPKAKERLEKLEAHVTRAMIADGNALIEKKQFDEASKKFKEVREREGGQKEGDAGLGRVKAARIRALLAQGNEQLQARSYDKALTSFKSVKKLEPKNAAAGKGIARAIQGKHDVHIAQGNECLARDQINDARYHYESAQKLMPKSVAAVNGFKRADNRESYLEGYNDGTKVGKEVAEQSSPPSSRANLAGAIRATEWRVRQQKEGIKEEPLPYQEGWQVGVDNAIRATFIAALPPEPKPEPAPVSVSHGSQVEYWVILFDGSESEAANVQFRAARAGLPAEVYDSSRLPVTGDPATLVAIGSFSNAAETNAMVARARAAGFRDAYFIKSE